MRSSADVLLLAWKPARGPWQWLVVPVRDPVRKLQKRHKALLRKRQLTRSAEQLESADKGFGALKCVRVGSSGLQKAFDAVSLP